jgi:hypothetical protein
MASTCSSRSAGRKVRWAATWSDWTAVTDEAADDHFLDPTLWPTDPIDGDGISGSGSLLLTYFWFGNDSTGSPLINDAVLRQRTITFDSLVAPATASVFAGPVVGPVGAPSANFTVTPNGTYAGTITITPAGGGLSTPIVLTFGGGEAAQSFTITPTVVGVVTLTVTNAGGLTDPPSRTYTATAPTPTPTPTPTSTRRLFALQDRRMRTV